MIERQHIEEPWCWCHPIVEYRDEYGNILERPLIEHNDDAGVGEIKEAPLIILP